MKKYNIALVGPGQMGKVHLSIINENLNSNIGAIIAPESEENYSIAKANGVNLFGDIEACLKGNNIDGIIISSPNEFHSDHLDACIHNKIPALIEKPLCSNLNDAINMLNKAKNLKDKILVGHHRTYSGILLAAKKLISEGGLGRPVSIVASAQFLKPDSYFTEAPWRKEKGGGPILINLIHEISVLRMLMGEISEVSGMISNSTRNHAVEDTVAINLRFVNGALGTIMLSDCAAAPDSWEHTSGENTVYPIYKNYDCYHISGTDGSIGVPTLSYRFFKNEDKKSWLTPFKHVDIEYKKVNPLVEQFNHFLRVISGEDLPKVTLDDGFLNLLVLEAIRKSAATAQVIELNKFFREYSLETIK